MDFNLSPSQPAAAAHSLTRDQIKTLNTHLLFIRLLMSWQRKNRTCSF